jgi:hypothetical protein
MGCAGSPAPEVPRCLSSGPLLSAFPWGASREGRKERRNASALNSRPVPKRAPSPEPCATRSGLQFVMHADVEDQAPPPSPVRERMAAAIVAVALGVTSFVFTARAFRGGPDDPPR